MPEQDHTDEAKRLAVELVELLERQGWPARLVLAGLAMACGTIAARAAVAAGQDVREPLAPLGNAIGIAAWTEQYRLAALERARLPAEKVN